MPSYFYLDLGPGLSVHWVGSLPSNRTWATEVRAPGNQQVCTAYREILLEHLFLC